MYGHPICLNISTHIREVALTHNSKYIYSCSCENFRHISEGGMC